MENAGDGARREIRKGFIGTVDDFRQQLLIPYLFNVGLRTSADFMIGGSVLRSIMMQT